jgi:hypothetical protein
MPLYFSKLQIIHFTSAVIFVGTCFKREREFVGTG